MYSANDGARLDRLLFNGFDLLTVGPKPFLPPVADYGRYETRPVYGYDDCFPTVSTCRYPGTDWQVPDHGEVCWLSWEVRENKNQLLFRVSSRKLPLMFLRKLTFKENKIIWEYEVSNTGREILPFQHVMHPLMPLNKVVSLQMPGFEAVYDDIDRCNLAIQTPDELEKYLLHRPAGTANMLFLRKVSKGAIWVGFANGVTLQMQFPDRLFPSIGLWWNNYGYPDEEGLRRCECAFEPVPGFSDNLAKEYKTGKCLFIEPAGTVKWKITWELKLTAHFSNNGRA